MQDHTTHTERNQLAVQAAIAYLAKRNKLQLLAKPLPTLGNGVCLYGCGLRMPRRYGPEAPNNFVLAKPA